MGKRILIAGLWLGSAACLMAASFEVGQRRGFVAGRSYGIDYATETERFDAYNIYFGCLSDHCETEKAISESLRARIDDRQKDTRHD